MALNRSQSHTPADGRGEPIDPDDTARYIGSLANELRGMAMRQDLGFLAYLLAMVVEEAEATAGRPARQAASGG